jgi:hypothetical protein
MNEQFQLLRGQSGTYYVRCRVCLVAPELTATHLGRAIEEAEQRTALHDACNPMAPEFARAWRRGEDPRSPAGRVESPARLDRRAPP